MSKLIYFYYSEWVRFIETIVEIIDVSCMCCWETSLEMLFLQDSIRQCLSGLAELTPLAQGHRS